MRCRAAVIRPMLLWYVPQAKQCRLNAYAQRQHTLAVADRTPFPVRIGQYAVANQMIERLCGDRDAQLTSMCEVRRHPSPRTVLLPEEHLLLRA